jgi:uncharacterized membrane protein
VLRALRPYSLQVAFVLYIPLILFLDSHLTSVYPQYGLGILTFGVLYLSTRWSPASERRQVWLCVAVATGFEVFGSLIWGLYRYQFHNLPLYVPPGHGLVYLFGLTAARTPLLRIHGRVVTRLALVLATVWAVSGLTWLPLLTGRVDVLGALCLPIFAWFILRSPRAGVFAAIFFCTSLLEIFGTRFGNWRWAATAPYLLLPAGNPPSVIAGGYCVIDGTVLLLAAAAARLPRRPSWPRRPLTEPALAPEAV